MPQTAMNLSLTPLPQTVQAFIALCLIFLKDSRAERVSGKLGRMRMFVVLSLVVLSDGLKALTAAPAASASHCFSHTDPLVILLFSLCVCGEQF